MISKTFRNLSILVLILSHASYSEASYAICKEIIELGRQGQLRTFTSSDFMNTELKEHSLTIRRLKEIAEGKRIPSPEEIRGIMGVYRVLLDVVKDLIDHSDPNGAVNVDLRGPFRQFFLPGLLAGTLAIATGVSVVIVSHALYSQGILPTMGGALATFLAGAYLTYAGTNKINGTETLIALRPISIAALRENYFAMNRLVSNLETSQKNKKPGSFNPGFH